MTFLALRFFERGLRRGFRGAQRPAKDDSTVVSTNSRSEEHTSGLAMELKRANAALAKFNAIPADFLSVMSYEFRTPLNLIMGYAEMMRDGLLGELTEEQKHGLEQILQSSNELLALLTRLPQASSLEGLSVKEERQEIALSEAGTEIKLSIK